MNICFYCEQQLKTNLDLLLHIKVAHRNLTAYRCMESDCKRSFSLYYSFWKHRKREHDISVIEVNNSVLTLNLKDVETESVKSTENFIETFPNNCDSVQKVLDSCYDDKVPCNDNEIVERLSECSISDYQIVGNDNDKKDFEFSFIQLLSKWYSIKDLPRKRVAMLIEDFRLLLLDECLDILKEKVCTRFLALGESQSGLNEMEEMFDHIKKPFHNLNSEHTIFKKFEKLGTLILPIAKIVDYRDEYQKKNNLIVIAKVPITVMHIPLRFVIEKFFAIPGVFEKTSKYIKKLNNCSSLCHNVIQAELWKIKIKNSEEKIILPLLLYSDEYETNNPLAAHKGLQKCCALYVKITCLPPEYQSKESSIFLLGLFNALDNQNSKIFDPAIEEINHLEVNGIEVIIDNEVKKIYFKLICIVGDNLGLHQMFGLVENFNATYFCRFCYTKRNDIDKIFDDKNCVLRDKISYKTDLEADDSQSRGIMRPCVFHSLSDFHLTTNYSVDLMHDLLEGVCQYDIGLIFYYYIIECKYFSIKTLNDLLFGFNYNFNDRQYRPPEFSETHLKNKKYSMGAAEMLCLMRNITLIIGHLIPPNNNQWQLVQLLQEIVLFVTEKFCQFQSHEYLADLISDYLSQLQTSFPNSFKPKHHLLIHYPRAMNMLGPLWHIACISFERKHRSSKVTSHVSISRRNIFYTLALKHQLILNYTFLVPQTIPKLITGPIKQMAVKDLIGHDLYRNCKELQSMHMLSVTKWVSYKGHVLKPNMILAIPGENEPSFYEVYYLILNDSSTMSVIGKQLVCCINEHFRAYEIINTQVSKFIWLSWPQIRTSLVTHKIRLGNSFEYIAKRWV